MTTTNLDSDNLLQDQRLFERFSARFPARYKDTRDTFGTTITLCDASANGIRFLSKERLYINDSVTLEVRLPEEPNPLIIRGSVVWVKRQESEDWLVGLQLHRVSLMSMYRLFKATSSHSFLLPY